MYSVTDTGSANGHGARSSAVSARIETPKAPRVWEGCAPQWGGVWPPQKKIDFGSENVDF